jgi:hypothetical protein
VRVCARACASGSTCNSVCVRARACECVFVCAWRVSVEANGQTWIQIDWMRQADRQTDRYRAPKAVPWCAQRLFATLALLGEWGEIVRGACAVVAVGAAILFRCNPKIPTMAFKPTAPRNT